MENSGNYKDNISDNDDHNNDDNNNDDNNNNNNNDNDNNNNNNNNNNNSKNKNNIFRTSSLSEMYFLSKMSEDNLQAKSDHHALISFLLAMETSFSLQDNAISAN